MISSMTGFGRAKAQTPIGTVSVESRSVNFRYIESSIRVNNNIAFMEMHIRDMIKSQFKRGKVDLYLKWEPSSDYDTKVTFNTELIQSVAEQYEKLRKKLKLEAPLDPTALIQLPQCVIVKQADIKESAVRKNIEPVVQKALDALEKNRRREGRILRKALKEYLGGLEKGCKTLQRNKVQCVEEYRARLRVRMTDLLKRSLEQPDYDRLEMEMAVLAEKHDVEEEIVRLASHLDMFHQLLSPKEGEAVGRQLDFLCVELQREINTISAKCRSKEVLPLTLEMKNLVEKLREQVQNIE